MSGNIYALKYIIPVDNANQKEVHMNTKKLVQVFVIVAVLVSAFATSSSAFAAGCGSSVAVVSGDTLFKIAQRCGTTVSALRRANPDLGSSNLIYPGQVLQLPGTILGTDGGYFLYIIARGDTLKGLAARFAVTVDQLLSWNPDIVSANLIYEGQIIKVYASNSTPPPTTPPPPPPGGQVYYVKRGDTLKIIAGKFNISVEMILQLNYIPNPNLIGDTLKIIANRFGTTVEKLLGLNPKITNPNLIYVGQVVQLW